MCIKMYDNIIIFIFGMGYSRGMTVERGEDGGRRKAQGSKINQNKPKYSLLSTP